MTTSVFGESLRHSINMTKIKGVENVQSHDYITKTDNFCYVICFAMLKKSAPFYTQHYIPGDYLQENRAWNF